MRAQRGTTHTRISTGIAAALLLTGLPATGASAQDPEAAVYDSVRVNGISLAYRDVGEGTPLVLLHGFTGTGAMWDPFLEDFSTDHRVIVPDLRGHGRSLNPSGSFTHRELAEDVFALLDELGIDHFSAIGMSMGAMTLLHAATMDPERVDAMVLVGGTPYLPESARRIYRGIFPDSIPAEYLEQGARQHAGGVEQFMQLQRQFRAYKDSYDDMSFTPPHLATIEASTLIVHGDRDAFFPVEMAMQMYDAIPESYLWVVPNGGHSAGIQESRFVQVVRDFLAGDWASR